jgi:hypothetical protein
MNFMAMREKPREDGMPRIVLFHNAADDPMNPFELLMAYEENVSSSHFVSFVTPLCARSRVTFCS